MSKKRTAGTDGSSVIDADTADDGDISNALGLDDAPDDDDDLDDDDTDDGDDDDEDEDDPLEALRAELREQKRTIARLTREAAAARVAGKGRASSAAGAASGEGGNASEGGNDGETVEQALERGKEEARLELGLERAGDRIRAALTGIVPDADLDDFVDDLRLERYVDEDGQPDADAIKALRIREAKRTRRRTSNVGHGRQGSGGVQKKSKGDLMGDTMTALGL